MRKLFKLLLFLLLLGAVSLAAVGWFALADSPTVNDRHALSHQDITRVRALLAGSDPRGLPDGTQQTIEITTQDLELAANYLVQRLADGRAEVRTDLGTAELRGSLRLPMLPARRYLNVTATLSADGRRVRVDRLQIGDLRVPPILAEQAAGWALRTVVDPKAASLLNAVSDIRLDRTRLQLTYEWHPDLLDRARDSLLTAADRAALGFYLDTLHALQAEGVGTGGALTELLAPMFGAAAERTAQSEDAVAENTALLTVLGTWASGRDVTRLVPDSQPPRRFRLKVHGRRDFAQHFLASAALAARGDTSLSDAIGLFKEIADTDTGSGFSFTDIAADRTGTRFGEIATRSHGSATRVQQRMQLGISDGDLMPRATDLPEHLDAATFRRTYGHVGSPAYEAVMAGIEQRIDALPLYRR